MKSGTWLKLSGISLAGVPTIFPWSPTKTNIVFEPFLLFRFIDKFL